MGAKTNLRYHIVLTTKYRKPCLKGIETEVYQVMREVEKYSSFKILAMGTEDGNHIHLAIKAPPKYSISGIVNRIKGMSQKRLWDTTPKHLSKFYWGKSKKLWHGAYYAATTGEVSTDQILEYIKKQNGPTDPTAIHRRSKRPRRFLTNLIA